MKKLLAILLSLTLVLTLAACGEEEEKSSKKKKDKDKEPSAPTMQMSGGNGNIIPIEPTFEATIPDLLTGEPNEDEKLLLDEYFSIARFLECYEDGVSADVTIGEKYYYGMENEETAKACYQRLLELDIVDRFSGSEYCAQKNATEAEYDGRTVSWDRQTYLSKFKSYENILLKTEDITTDYVGNETNGGGAECYLLVDGVLHEDIANKNSLKRQDSYYEISDYEPTEIYDESGKLVKVEYRSRNYYSSGDIEAIRVPQYENGLRVKDVITTTSGYNYEVFYAYDAQGRLIQIKWGKQLWDFTYDEKGNQVKQVWTQLYSDDVDKQTIYTYTYDDKGHLATGTVTDHEYGGFIGGNRYIAYETVDQVTYTCDAEGNILSAKTVYGNTIRMSGSSAGEVYRKPTYVSRMVNYIYGDLFIYAV